MTQYSKTMFLNHTALRVETDTDIEGRPVVRVTTDDGAFTLDPNEVGPVLSALFNAGRTLVDGDGAANAAEPTVQTCPRCGGDFDARYPAMSRVTADRTIAICSDCGNAEGLAVATGEALTPQQEWPVHKVAALGGAR